jgi:hypothetical protein
MASHNSGGALHQASGGLGPVFVVPASGVYWVDTDVSGPGSVQLVNATTQAVIARGNGQVQLTAGIAVQFQTLGTTAATTGAGGRIIPYSGIGGV